MGARFVIEPLPALPPEVGLIPTVRTLGSPFFTEDTSGSDEHWLNGFAWEPESCGDSGTVPICESSYNKTISDARGSLEYIPFAVWAGDKCSAFDYLTRDYPGRAMRQLRACESSQVADELWTGSLSTAEGHDNNYFAKPGVATVLSSSTGFVPTDALACLEQYLQDCSCGTTGMIHTTADVVTAWRAEHLIEKEGKLLRTILGTYVIPDAGYPGTAPENVDDQSGVRWAYASSYVQVHLGSIDVIPGDVSEALQRGHNTIEYRAERPAAAWWDDCCLGAVGVQIDSCLTLGS